MTFFATNTISILLLCIAGRLSVGANLVFVPFPQNRLLASKRDEYKIRPYGKLHKDRVFPKTNAQ